MITKIILAGFLVGYATVGLIACWLSYNHSDKEIIQHGCAKYNPETGAFEWRGR